MILTHTTVEHNVKRAIAAIEALSCVDAPITHDPHGKPAWTEQQTERPSEEQLAARKKAKAKIRTIRIWAWIILSLLALTALLSTMRHEQATDETKCGGILREKHSFC